MPCLGRPPVAPTNSIFVGMTVKIILRVYLWSRASSRYPWRIIAAATASLRTGCFLAFDCLFVRRCARCGKAASRINFSAETVESRSSRYSSGAFTTLVSLSTNDLTFSACSPRLPESERGSPTMTFPTWSLSTIAAIVLMSSSSSLRSMIVKGLASMPSGSLKATPIRLSPISIPRIRRMKKF